MALTACFVSLWVSLWLVRQAAAEKRKVAAVQQQKARAAKGVPRKKKGGGNIFSAIGNLILLGGAGVAALTLTEDKA